MTAGLHPPPFPHGFPLRQNCDPKDPYQAFLWMLVALPGQQGGQLVMPVGYLQLVSKRLWDLGARPVEEPTLKYRKPGNLAPNWLTSPGDWVSLDTPDDDPRTPARKAADSLVPLQKAELIRELAKDLTPRQRHEFAQKLAAQQQDGEPE
jgi:hypothetical protein